MLAALLLECNDLKRYALKDSTQTKTKEHCSKIGNKQKCVQVEVFLFLRRSPLGSTFQYSMDPLVKVKKSASVERDQSHIYTCYRQVGNRSRHGFPQFSFVHHRSRCVIHAIEKCGPQ